MITSITPSLDLIEPLMATLVSIMQNSTVSLPWAIDADFSVLEDEDALHACSQFGVFPKSFAVV